MAGEEGRFDPRAGLCSLCAHVQVVRSARGSTFWLCERSRGDSRFRRYPPLPVRACAGFEPVEGQDAGDS
jgi:hypothetical protein